jgi:hypothetical protein
MKTLCALVLLSAAWLEPLRHQASAQTASGVAILQVDTDRRLGTIDRKIYGQFLEHINHAVVDGLFAEQIRGAGFEGKDFETYWTSFGPPGAVRIVEVPFERGAKSVRLIGSRQPTGSTNWIGTSSSWRRRVERPRRRRMTPRCRLWSSPEGRSGFSEQCGSDAVLAAGQRSCDYWDLFNSKTSA